MATGNSKAAKSARVKLQLRDKKGRWIEMGGGVKWWSPNLGKFMFGKAVDATPSGQAVVEIEIPDPTSKDKKITKTLNIQPSLLEKIKSKATLNPDAPKESIDPKLTTPDTSVKPDIDKSNELFKSIHKNPATHAEPFGPNYEEAPAGTKADKGDFVVINSEGTTSKAQVTGYDPKTLFPKVQKEQSSTWGFSGDSYIINPNKIAKVFKAVPSSPTNQGDDKKAKVDAPVPSPNEIKQGGFLNTPAPKPNPEAEKEAAEKKVKEAAEADMAKKESMKIDKLKDAYPDSILISNDDDGEAVNLTKHEYGYWTEKSTGTNYTSTEVAEKFKGNKNLSIIAPNIESKETDPNSEMTSEQWKKTLDKPQLMELNDTEESSPYLVTEAPYKNFPGFNMAEEEAIIEYVQDSSPINNALRKNTKYALEDNKKNIAGLDSVLDKSVLAEPTTVYRGVRVSGDMFNVMSNDGIYHDKGYSSTSSKKSFAADWVSSGNWGNSKAVILEINMPAGFKAHKIDYALGKSNGWGIENYDSEEEVILPRNTAFKVLSITKDSYAEKYHAVVEPVLTDHNSKKGTTNDGNTGNNTGGDNSNGNNQGTDTPGSSEPLHSPAGGDNNSNSGGSGSDGGGAEQSPEAGTKPGNEAGPLTETPSEPQELGKLYTDAQGQYMAGTDGQKFRKGDTVSYTKKGVTQEGKVIALYEGVKSARVEWPDGTNSIKKINTLKSNSKSSQDDTAPVQDKPEPVAEAPKLDSGSIEYEDPAPFNADYDSPDKLPIGTKLELNANKDFKITKIGENAWQVGDGNGPDTTDSSIALAQGLKNQGQPSYNIYMPKNTSPEETATPSVDTVDAVDNFEAEVSTTPEIPNFEEEMPSIEKEKSSANFEVMQNAGNVEGFTQVVTKDGSPISVGVDTLVKGDKIYPVGTQTKPYASHGNSQADLAFIATDHPAGIGEVVDTLPNKPYIKVKGSDGKDYFPAKTFVATKQSDEIDSLLKGSKTEVEPEEVASFDELTEMEAAAENPAAPIDVSSWKKLKNSTGSNPGGEYEAPDGTHYFIKQSKSDLHAKNEILASDIYQAAGVHSLELGYANVDGSGKLGTIAPMIANAKDNLQSKLASDPEYKKEFQKGWAIDAWLGNWDVVGLAYDNAITDGNGKAIRVDPGGALLFRAMGSPKTDAMFGDKVTEWDSMRTNPDNYQTFDAFNSMTDQQIKDSVKLVAGFSDAKIDELVDKHDFDEANATKLKNRLKARRDDLIKRANGLGGELIETPLAQWEIDLLNGISSGDDLIDSMDEDNKEITNEDISPATPVSQSPQVQEALDALKKKLQGEDTKKEDPQEEFDDNLADWEKELLGLANEENKAKATEETKSSFDVANAKPGTVFKNDKGQDAVVGKNNSVVEFGVTVEYTKKGETKTGTVSNMMPNQQSAKVLWSDGSSSIIKGSQLYAKKNESNNSKVADAPSVDVSENSQYDTSKWNSNSAFDAASELPVGTVITKDMDSKFGWAGWQKTGPNEWKSASKNGLTDNSATYTDNDFNEVKSEDYYQVYIPKNNVEVTSENEVDPIISNDMVSKPFADFISNAHMSELPVNTEIFSIDENGKPELRYTKIEENYWQSDATGNTYTDTDIQSINPNNKYVKLPEDKGITWFNGGSVTAEKQPIGSKVTKGKSVITKTSDITWESNSGFVYTNTEVNAFQKTKSWMLQEPIQNETKSEEKTTAGDFDLMINALDVANNEILDAFSAYLDTHEENGSWDNFTAHYEEGDIDFEENNIFVGEKAFKIVPGGTTGPTQFVSILDENGDYFDSVKVSNTYGNYNKGIAEKNLEDFFTKQFDAQKKDTNSSKPKIKELIWDYSNNVTAESFPAGTQIKYNTGSTVLTKEASGEWSSPNGSTYDNGTINNLKDANWTIVLKEDNSSSVVPEKSEEKPQKEKWTTSHPAAAYMPNGTTIGDKTETVVFEKISQSQWQAKNMPNVIHSNDTMDQIKGETWYITMPEGATVDVPKPKEETKSSSKGMTSDEFKSEFYSYLDSLGEGSWIEAKGTEQEFTTPDGSKFAVKPHPLSTAFFKSLQITDADGNVVPSDIELQVDDDYVPVGYTPVDIFKIAEAYAAKKNPINIAGEEYTLENGIGLDAVSYNDFVAVPAGTKINYMLNGKIHGTFLKNKNNSWRYQENNKEKPSHKTETNDDFKYLMENNKAAAANYVMVAPDAPVIEEEKAPEAPKVNPNHLTGVMLDDVSQIEKYPAGTVLKFEQSQWNNTNKAHFFVKQANGLWNQMQKTPSTLTEKKTGLSSNFVYSQFNSWYKNPASISIPTSPDALMLGNGEHAYVGDVVMHADSGDVYTIDKINKTSVKVVTSDGAKVSVPWKKLYKDQSFGIKKVDPNANTYGNSKYDTSTTDPLSAWVDSIKAEEAIKEQLINFAGASAEEYDKQGLGLNVSPDATKHKNMGLSVIEVDPNNTSNALYGTPAPVAPESPDDYPSFEESVLNNLPQWDSAEWLKKVEERYLQNPNKKFDSVQKSTQWNKIQEVIKGNDGYKSYLNQLLSNKYVDQELYDMAESAIKAQELANKPLKKAHNENIAKEKAEYEAKKTEYFAEYESKMKQYTETFAEWSKVNTSVKNVKKLPKFPPLSSTPFTGGPADWTKAHTGTYAVQTIMDSMRNDNLLGRFGLAASIDGDKIEETAVTFNKVKDIDGTEKFEVTFKLTHAFGAHMNNKLKADPSVKKSQGIYYNKKTNMLGKPDDELAKLDGKPGNSNFVNSGTRHEFTNDAVGAKIVFQHASQEGQNVSVNHNAVQVLLPTNATPAELQLVLEQLGIDAKPSTAGALRVVAENKLITLFSGDSNWGNENFKGDKRQKSLDKVKKNFNITADDVVVENDANGRLKFFLTDAKVTEFMSKSKVREFKHSVYAGEDVDVWESILSGANAGLASNYFRGNNGIGELKSSTGMSPDKDMSIGSGAGVFITPHGSKETSAPYYNWVGIDAKAIMRRLDYWGNAHDNYGKNDKGASTPFQLMQQMGSFHEVMPRDTIPVSDFTWVTIASAQAKKQVIKRLTDKGIFMINGIPLENFILTNHETITPLPAPVNIIGGGIAPSGAAAV